ncbi:MAG: hypothetical protein J5I98_36565 [Phaeodactylibacter sp.]|nr:hypothetical protein [Phaeodactylibacter sp.]
MPNKPASPFKFLSPYDRRDTDIFFGREQEVAQLYEYVFQTSLLLVYGQSGTGKTSLVQCGLAGRFQDSDWLDLYIRHNGDMDASLKKAIREKMESPPDGDAGPLQLLFSLYLDYLRPIYLIFDQLEELFILGEEEEQKAFIQQILKIVGLGKSENEEEQRLLDAVAAGALPCKVIFIIREEYLAHLYAFEKEADALFRKRLRVEPMSKGNARQVIRQTAERRKQLLAPVPETIAKSIVEAVAERERVRLPYLQVFLDFLYREAPMVDGKTEFDAATVNQLGQLKDVLAAFLDEQLRNYEAKGYGTQGQAVNFLKAFVSQKGTRRPLPARELPAALPGYNEADIGRMLDFFEDCRILNPMENEQYELAHDSLAAKLFQMEARTVEMPMLEKGSLPEKLFPGLLPYQPEQALVFLGREEEIQELFDKIVNDLSGSVTLLYGPTGTGKTSLVQAGLLPRMQQLFPCRLITCNRAMADDAQWRHVFGAPPAEAETGSRILDIAFGNPLPAGGQRRFLFFDQAEEWFRLLSKEMLDNLYSHLRLIYQRDRACGMAFVVREEYFSHLPAFQAKLPQILERQYRLEPMGREKTSSLAIRLLKLLEMEQDAALQSQILSNVVDEEGNASLSLLQAHLVRIQQQLVNYE